MRTTCPQLLLPLPLFLNLLLPIRAHAFFQDLERGSLGMRGQPPAGKDRSIASPNHEIQYPMAGRSSQIFLINS
ncbi:hypothetical protein GQ55_8G159900 [Panicum hallii var. hallii]|uniref:Uncharacterized protein n=1 Tax=Panicum hallii var. hallii TaxID=1504633 RepID=A0A2T7CND0_9POAL|nr:hypothetical protein GQ55_8G159900 [Panicum hallii var. hallii]